MSDTPDTDAAVIAAGGDWSPVLRAVSQRLERQRDEAREEAKRLDGAYEDATNYYARIIELTDERDEALAVADTLSGIASAYLGWQLSRTPHGADDRSLEVARNVTAAIKRWKELKR